MKTYPHVLGLEEYCENLHVKIFQAIFDIQLITESEVYMGDKAWKDNFNNDFLENRNMRKKK